MTVQLYKRPNSPYWYFDLTVNGDRKRTSTKRTVKREAQAVAEEALRRALDKSQLGVKLQQITVKDAIYNHYLAKRRGELNDRRYKDLEYVARKVLGEVEGIKGLRSGIRMDELTHNMLVQYRTGRMGNKAAVRTIDHEMRLLSAAYHMVAGDYQVTPGLKFPIERPKGQPRFLTEDEEASLLAELDPKRPLPMTRNGKPGKSYFLDPTAQAYRQRQDNYDLVVMLLDTGCRYNEIAQLTWDLVDAVDWQWLHIFRWKVGNEGKLAITNRMREVLQRRFKDRRNSHYVFPGWKRDTDQDGPRQSTLAIRRAMEKIGINHPAKVKRFGRRDVRSLRDTFASKLRMKGMSLDRLQKLLGHASPEMTQKYANLTVDHASTEAAAILNSLNGDTQ